MRTHNWCLSLQPLKVLWQHSTRGLGISNFVIIQNMFSETFDTGKAELRTTCDAKIVSQEKVIKKSDCKIVAKNFFKNYISNKISQPPTYFLNLPAMHRSIPKTRNRNIGKLH